MLICSTLAVNYSYICKSIQPFRLTMENVNNKYSMCCAHFIRAVYMDYGGEPALVPEPQNTTEGHPIL